MKFRLEGHEDPGVFSLAHNPGTGTLLFAVGAFTHPEPDSTLPEKAAAAAKEALKGNRLVGGVICAVVNSALHKLYAQTGIFPEQGPLERRDPVDLSRMSEAKRPNVPSGSVAHVAMHVDALHEAVVAAIGNVTVEFDGEAVAVPGAGRLDGGSYGDRALDMLRRKLNTFQTLVLRTSGLAVIITNDGSPELVMEGIETNGVVGRVQTIELVEKTS